jgi:hypothetical protein
MHFDNNTIARKDAVVCWGRARLSALDRRRPTVRLWTWNESKGKQKRKPRARWDEQRDREDDHGKKVKKGTVSERQRQLARPCCCTRSVKRKASAHEAEEAEPWDRSGRWGYVTRLHAEPSHRQKQEHGQGTVGCDVRAGRRSEMDMLKRESVTLQICLTHFDSTGHNYRGPSSEQARSCQVHLVLTDIQAFTDCTHRKHIMSPLQSPTG